MRYLAVLLFVLSIGVVHADEIKCYSNGHLIYKRQATDFSYQEGVFAFEEMKTGKYVFISANCIVKVKP